MGQIKFAKQIETSILNRAEMIDIDLLIIEKWIVNYFDNLLIVSFISQKYKTFSALASQMWGFAVFLQVVTGNWISLGFAGKTRHLESIKLHCKWSKG